MKHTIRKHPRRLYIIEFPQVGAVYEGIGERATAQRMAKHLDAAAIDYTAPDAGKRIVEAATAFWDSK